MSAPEYAAHLVQGSVAQNMRALLSHLAWSYIAGEPQCLWNGVDITVAACRRYKRSENGPPQNFSCDIPHTLTSTSTLPTSTTTSTSITTSSTVYPTPARTAVPPQPYSNVNDFSITWQESADPNHDNCISWKYFKVLISYEDSAFTLNAPQDWCLQACRGKTTPKTYSTDFLAKYK